MDRAFLNIPANYQSYLFVFAVMVFVLLMSCPVKSSIKGLIGVPTNTEHASKNSGVLGSGSEQCVVWEASDTKIAQTPSKMNDLLPVIVLMAVFLFLCNIPYAGGASTSPLRYPKNHRYATHLSSVPKAHHLILLHFSFPLLTSISQ